MSKQWIADWRRSRHVKKVVKCVRAMHAAGRSPDDMIGYLKAEGFAQSTSVFILQSAGVGDNFRCKCLVIESEHWSDLREANEALQDAIGEHCDT